MIIGCAVPKIIKIIPMATSSQNLWCVWVTIWYSGHHCRCKVWGYAEETNEDKQTENLKRRL